VLALVALRLHVTEGLHLTAQMRSHALQGKVQ
jgi:hypothetical protein